MNLLIVVPYSVGIALVVTYLTKPVALEKLIAFARKVQPGGPGWRRVEAEIRKTDPGFRSHSPLQWANAGRCAAAIASVYCLLFGVGKLMVGDTFRPDAWIPNRVIGGVLVGLGVVLGWLVARSFSQRRWAAADAEQAVSRFRS